MDTCPSTNGRNISFLRLNVLKSIRGALSPDAPDSDAPDSVSEAEVPAGASSLELSVTVEAKDLTRGTHEPRAKCEDCVYRERPDESFWWFTWKSELPGSETDLREVTGGR